MTPPTPGLGPSTWSAPSSRSWAWAASCSASLAGRGRVGRRPPGGRGGRSGGAGRLAQAAEASGQADPARPRPVQVQALPAWDLQQLLLQQIALGGTMIALPIYLQMVLEYNAMLAGSPSPRSRSACSGWPCSPGSGRGKATPERHHPARVFLLLTAMLLLISDRAASPTPAGTSCVPLVIAGSGLGLVSQLNNYTLAPISEERVSEAAGVNSAGGSFGLVRAGLRRGDHAGHALVLLHQHGGGEHRAVPGGAGARRERTRGGRPGHEHTQPEELLAGSPRTSGTRSSASTPTRGRWPFRWRCRSRSSPAWSGCPTRSGWCACQTSSHRARWKGWPWADDRRRPVLPVGPLDPGRRHRRSPLPRPWGRVVVAEPLVERIALQPVLHRVLHLGEP